MPWYRRLAAALAFIGWGAAILDWLVIEPAWHAATPLFLLSLVTGATSLLSWVVLAVAQDLRRVRGDVMRVYAIGYRDGCQGRGRVERPELTVVR